MNSRERFLAAANHTEPDRAPLDFGVTRSGGFTADTDPQRIVRFRNGLTRQARILGDSVAYLPRWPGHLSPCTCACFRSRSRRLVRPVVFGPSSAA